MMQCIIIKLSKKIVIYPLKKQAFGLVMFNKLMISNVKQVLLSLIE